MKPMRPKLTLSSFCQKCGGSGKIPVTDWDFTQCECLYIRKMQSHLGADLSLAKAEFTSPLYVASSEPGEPPTTDLTEENVFLKGWWSHLLGHIKWALVCKGLLFRFSIISDEKIRSVFVGNESSRARRGTAKEQEGANNGLADLVEDVDLLIIRLGFLGYKNIAMSGALLETLRIREFRRKPTWLVEEPNSLFGPGHFSYSEEVADYIDRGFEVINLTTEHNRAEPMRGIAGTEVTDEDGDMGLEYEPSAYVPKPAVKREPVQSVFNPRPTEDILNSSLFSDKPRKSNSGKKRTGGGPL